MSCDLRRPWLGAVVVALAWVVGCKVDALFQAGRAPDPPPPQPVFAPPPAAAAAQLGFTVQPHGAPAGSVITPAVQVTALDALGNVVSSFTGDVTMVLGANPTGATLGGTTRVAAVDGVASFASLSINKAGTYTLTASASASGLTSATSDPFDITPGPPPPTGDLTVTTATTGLDLDPNGYTVTVDGGQSRSLGVTASTTYTLTAASHTVDLTSVAANCTVSGQNPRTVTVLTGGRTTTITIT